MASQQTRIVFLRLAIQQNDTKMINPNNWLVKYMGLMCVVTLLNQTPINERYLYDKACSYEYV